MASVNFTMDDINTSQTLATAATVRQYDSDKPAQEDQSSGKMAMLSGATRAMGLGGSNTPPPADQITSDLIDACVEEFIGKISPHEVVVKEPLLKGKSEAVKTGNALAVAKDYAEALEAYQSAVKLNAEDHEAVFNSGLMYEALGKLDQAASMYDQAFKIKPEQKYVLARKRAQTESVK